MALAIALAAGLLGLIVLVQVRRGRRAGLSEYGPAPAGGLSNTQPALVVALVLWVLLTAVAGVIARDWPFAGMVLAGQLAHVAVAFAVLRAARARTLTPALSARELTRIGVRAAFAAFLLVSLTSLCLNGVYRVFDVSWPTQDVIGAMSDGFSLDAVVLAVCAVTAAPFAEEVVFRGILLPALAKQMPLRRALLVSAVIFAFIHVWSDPRSWPLAIPLSVVGWILGVLYVRTGSLRTSIVCHAVFNAINTSMALTA